jgi:hypothetical protein
MTRSGPLKLTEEGCICHGPNGGDDGVPNPNVTVLFKIDPPTTNYEVDKVYKLTVGVLDSDVPVSPTGNKGGFNLKVNVGTLAAAPGFEAFVQGTSLEMTHTKAGDQNARIFELTWTAPHADEGAAVFVLFVNAVNGDGMNNAADHWSKDTKILAGPTGEFGVGGGPVDPSKVGVRYFAHWVGVISMLAVVVTLVLYYFVLKYGESIHTTDHRDRQEK